jgi:hypothetical protein
MAYNADLLAGFNVDSGGCGCESSEESSDDDRGTHFEGLGVVDWCSGKKSWK